MYLEQFVQITFSLVFVDGKSVRDHSLVAAQQTPTDGGGICVERR